MASRRQKPIYAFIDSQNLNLAIHSLGGYHLIFKPTVTHKIKGKHETKGNVDAELVLHTMIQFPHYSKAIIVSGDGDFHCLIEYLKLKNKLAKIIVPNRKKYSQLYRKFKDDLYFLNNLKAKLASSEKIKRGRRRRHQHR